MHLKRKAHVFVLAAAAVCALALVPPGLPGLSMDELVSRALARDPGMAQSLAQLHEAQASLSASSPWRSSSLSLQSTLKDTIPAPPAPAGSSSAGPDLTWAASASVPLAVWLSLGASVNGDDTGKSTGALSVSVAPLAIQSTEADYAYRSALVDYGSTLRSTILDIRKSLRAMRVSEAEAAWRKADLGVAETAVERAALLAERGEGGRTDLLDAIALRTEAQANYDVAVNASAAARSDAALRIGLEAPQLPDSAALEALDRNPGTTAPGDAMTLDQWLNMSSSLVKAEMAADKAESDAKKAVPRPDISLKGDVSSILSGTSSGTLNWSVGATVKLPIDLVFRDRAEAKAESAAAKRSSARNTRISAAAEYALKVAELSRTFASWRKAANAAESARLAVEEAQLLYSLGRRSDSELASVQAQGLRADWQAEAGRKSLLDALDILDARFAQQ